MKRVVVGFIAAAVLVSMPRTAMAQDQTKTVRSQTRVETAVVEAIDPATRTLTLKKKDGTVVTVVAGPDITRFPEIKVGDKVTARYYENLVVRLKKPGEPDAEITAKTTTPAGQALPGGLKVTQRTVSATITEINVEKPSITFTEPNGGMHTAKVQDKAALATVKIGDKVDIVLTEAMAVSLTPGAVETTDCGANVGDRHTCDADTSSGVVLVHQAGEGNCSLGRTWGFDDEGVWVADGCRGTFAFGDNRPTVSCSAVTGSREECKADTRAGVALASGLPVCVLGRTWGYDEDGIWVSEGCQATFVLTTRDAVECASVGARQHCAADSSAGVVLSRMTTTAPCVLGETWGYDGTGVWVDKGCGARFVLGNARPGGSDNKDLNDFFGQFEPYGRLRGHVAFFNEQAEVQDSASYLGLNFSTRGPTHFFAALEWGVSLVRGGQQFSSGGPTTGGGYPELENPQAGQVFSNRIANVGVDFGWFGRIAIGKQWGVHTDVTLYTTDQFVVFGSQASATYTAGTDGGFLGTGRADQTVSYHNNLFRVLRIGGQLQFRPGGTSERLVDGAGVSAQLTIAPGVRLAAAYSKSFFDDQVFASIRALDEDAEFAAVGLRINWRYFYAGLVYVRQSNGDLARIPLPGAGGLTEAVAFDAEGFEGLLRANFKGFSVYGGVNYYRPHEIDPILNPEFRTRYAIGGINAGIMSNMYAYIEARFLDDSIGASGEQGFDAVAIGVHYGFSLKGFHRR